MLIDDRAPPWIDKKIKGLIHEKKLVYKKHLEKNNSNSQRALSQTQDHVRQLLRIQN